MCIRDSTRDVDVLNVTLNSGSLTGICQSRLGIFQRELFAAYNETKGNLQMFGTPFDFNWYYNVSSYYGYRIHPISGANQLHNGVDIGVPEGKMCIRDRHWEASVTCRSSHRN